MNNKELVTPVGTRIYVTLMGDHDNDVFITQDDMSESHWEMLMGCHHSGSCDEDAEEAAKYFEISNYHKAMSYLVDCGIEREKFLDENDKRSKNETAILQYYLWMLAGDIQDRLSSIDEDKVEA